MKIIVIGLGNFGTSLSLSLIALGNEVLGVDMDFQKTEQLKDKLTSTICLDFTSELALANLPINSADVVVNAIGDDFGKSILVAALLKQANIKNLYCRSSNQLHKSILESIGIENIIMPDQDYARLLATQISLPDSKNAYNINEEFQVVEIKAPEKFFNLTFEDTGIQEQYNIRLLMIKHIRESQNIFGVKRKKFDFSFDNPVKHTIHKDDILILFGKIADLQTVFIEK